MGGDPVGREDMTVADTGRLVRAGASATLSGSKQIITI